MVLAYQVDLSDIETGHFCGLSCDFLIYLVMMSLKNDTRGKFSCEYLKSMNIYLPPSRNPGLPASYRNSGHFASFWELSTSSNADAC